MAYREIANINLENAQIIYKNFSGQPSQYNKDGKKTFNVILPEDPDYISKLVEEGWNVHITKPSERFPEPRHHLPVEARFDNYPPTVYMYVDGNRHGVQLDGDTISRLDKARIKSVDVVIGPYVYEDQRTGEEKIKAYLKVMHVTIAKPEDVFAYKYAEEEHPEDE